MMSFDFLSQQEFFSAAITDDLHREFVFQGNAYCSLQIFCFLVQFFRTDPSGYYKFEDRFPYEFSLFRQVPEHVLKQESRCSVYCYASAAAGCNLQDLDNFFPAPVRNFNLLKLKVLSKFSDDKFNIRVNSEVLSVFSKSVYCRNLDTYRRFEIIRAPEKEISEVFIVLDIGESVPEQKTVKKSFEAFVFFRKLI